MTFAPTTRQAIEDFARSVGLSAAPGPDGSFTFVFERSGTLSFTSSTDGSAVIMSLAAPPRLPSGEDHLRALQRARFDVVAGRFIHAGLGKDDSIVFALSIEEGALHLPLIEECLQLLLGEHRALG